MNNFLYTADMKMADLLHADYKLLLLLSRFELLLGFGDKTVEECCQQQHISCELFLMICNVYSFEAYLPGTEEIGQIDVTELLIYLQRSHGYYLDQRLHSIGERLNRIVQPGDQKHKLILNRFFEEYKNEVHNHFKYEEEVVFPYIRAIQSGQHPESYRIDVFEENHTNIDDKLNDLKNILIKYLPGHKYLSERVAVLLDIFSLEEDLCKHTLIEDKILIPLVRKMESTHGTRK